MNDGWIKLHRKILDNPVSNKTNYLAVWVYLILKANREVGHVIIRNEKITIPVGAYFGSIKKIAEHFDLSKSTVHAILEYFELEKMVERNKNGEYTMVKVLNWDEYQNTERKANGKRTESETNNKEKKDKNIRSNSEYLRAVPDEDLGDLSGKYGFSKDWIKSKAEKLYLWVEETGKNKSNYHTFLARILAQEKEKKPRLEVMASGAKRASPNDHY